MKKTLKTVRVAMVVLIVTIFCTNISNVLAQNNYPVLSCSGKNVVEPCIHVDPVTTSVERSSDDYERGIFLIKFKVTALGGDVYIPRIFPAKDLVVDQGGVAMLETDLISKDFTNLTNWDGYTKDNIKIKEGETDTLSLVVYVMANSGGLYRVSLKGLTWDTKDLNSSNMSKRLTVTDMGENAQYLLRTEYLVLNPSNGLDGQRKLTVVSPNGGEEWMQNSKVEIKWNVKNTPKDGKVRILLLNEDGTLNSGLIVKEGNKCRFTNQKGDGESRDCIDINSGVAQVYIPSGLSIGKYKVNLSCFTVELNYCYPLGAVDSSNETFKVISSVTQTPTPIGSVPVSVKSSDVVLKVNSNQLTMLYSHGANEDLLTGVVSFSINGGKNGINIYEYPGISVIDSKGVRVSPQSTQSSLSAVGNVQKIKDDQGRSLFVIPAGKTVFFESKIAMSPLEMFSGTYYASLEYIYGNTNADRSNAVYLSIPKNKSNTVTVVGEKSPYIASITNPVNVGEKLSINGVRLLNKKFASVYIDGAINTAANSTLDGSKDGTVLWFVVPSLKNGYHTLFVKDSINGQSNRVSFEVGGGLVTPEITSVVPSKGPVGTQVAVKGVQLKSKVNNLVSLCSKNSCGNYTGHTSEDGSKVSFIVPNIPFGVYNLSIIDLVENNSSTNSLPFTVTQSTPTSTPPVTVATSSLAVTMKSSEIGNVTSNKGDTILLATVSFDSKNNPVLLQSFNFDVVVSGGKTAGDIFSNIMVASPAGKTQLTPSLHMKYDNMNLLVQPGKSNVAYITATLNSGIPNGTKAYVRINSNAENVKAIDSKSNPVTVEPVKMLSSGIITFTSPVVNTSSILNALLSVFGL